MPPFFPKLHIFLGAGGVGKTTLSAALALSLANAGKKVGLLSIDPAKRLQSALGLQNLTEFGTSLELSKYFGSTNGQLHAGVLHIHESLMRWVGEKGMDPEKQKKLFENPYFSALAYRLAASLDTLAAVRVAEWVEQYPQVEDLVIDTAPGLHALDFLTKPQKVASFLDSKIMDWLKWFVGDSSQKSNLVTLFFKSSARKILDGLSMVGGKAFILNFSEFLILLDEVFITALERLKYTQKWLKHSSTNIIFVSSLREDSVLMVKEMNKMLNDLGKSQRIAVINRCLPVHLKKEKSFQNFVNADALTNQNEHLFRNYLFSYYYNELRVKKEFLNFSKFIIQVPVYANFDSNFDLRLQDLCALGDQIRQQAGNHFL